MPAYCQAMVIWNKVDVVQSLQTGYYPWILSRILSRILSMETSLKPQARSLRNHAIGILPAFYRDVWLEARQPTTFAIRMMTWATAIQTRPLRILSTSLNHLPTTPSSSSPLIQTRHLGEQNPGTISLQPYVHLNHENPKFDDMFILNRKSNLDPSLHDCSNLHEYRRTAMDIINSFRSSNIPVPFWDFYNFLEFTPKFTTKPFNQAWSFNRTWFCNLSRFATKPNPPTKPNPSTKPDPPTNEPISQLTNQTISLLNTDACLLFCKYISNRSFWYIPCTIQ